MHIGTRHSTLLTMTLLQVTEFLYTLAVLALFFASTFSWGTLATWLIYDNAPRSWPYTSAVGLSLWIFVGGLLNSYSLAYGAALDAMLGLGLILLAVRAIRALRSADGRGAMAALRVAWSRWRPAPTAELLPSALILAVGAFRMATLVPAGVFNIHDDFQSYFVAPVRMLQTGAMTSGTFDLMAPSVHGAQAFFHGFILRRFPIAAINAFDLVFCFMLTGFLIDSVGRRLMIKWPFRLVAALVMIFIHPVYVNVSALYSGSAMLVAAVYAALILVETEDAAPAGARIRAAVPVSLLTGSLITFKVTFLPFAIMFMVFLSLVVWWRLRDVRNTARLVVSMVLLTAAFLAPWISLTFDDHWSLATSATARIESRESVHERYASQLAADLDALLSRQDLYGNRLFPYTFCVICMAVWAAAALGLVWRGRRSYAGPSPAVGIAASFAAVGSYLPHLLVLHAGRPDLIIRYPCPVLIGVWPVAMLIFVRGLVAGGPAARKRQVAAPLMLVMLSLCAAVVLGLFAEPAVTRAGRLVRARTMIPFGFDADQRKYRAYKRYVEASLQRQAADDVRKAQSATGTGQVLLAWISLPFHLDFARNPIVPMDGPGARRVWRGLGKGAEADDLRRYLQAKGIRHVMWQYDGHGVHRGEKYAGMNSLMMSVANRSRSVYRDDRIAVFDLTAGVSDSQGRRAVALERLRRAVEQNPHDAPARHDLGGLLHQMGELNAAIEHYRAALRLDPERWRTHYLLGEALRATSDVPGAIEAYRSALRLKSDDADAHNGIALALVTLNRADEAAGHFERVVALEPERDSAHYNLAVCLQRLGRSVQAIEQYGLELKRRPDNVPALNNLAMLLSAGGRHDEAIEHYNAAVAADPRSIQLRVNLADAYAAASRYDHAAAAARRALELATKTGDDGAAEKIRKLLEQYQRE